MTAISSTCWSESDQKAVREQLVRILNSGPFLQSGRRQRFLEYLVNETLAGRGERLKGYNIDVATAERERQWILANAPELLHDIHRELRMRIKAPRDQDHFLDGLKRAGFLLPES